MGEMASEPRGVPRVGLGYLARAVLVIAAAVLVPSRSAFPELRPLVREMLENLGSVDRIGEGVAVNDYDKVRRAALDLKARAGGLKGFDLATLGIDPSRDPQFDAFLAAQEQAADAIVVAAKNRDGRGAVLGVQQLFQNACIPCHVDFRERSNLLRPSVLFMTTYLSAWRAMNRGLSMNDLALVGRRAREIEAMGRVLAWDQVIESTFGLVDAAERKAFRAYLGRLNAQASRIEQAAVAEDVPKITEAVRKMWEEGCISCHERFRKAD
jgi:cytochrome c556